MSGSFLPYDVSLQLKVKFVQANSEPLICNMYDPNYNKRKLWRKSEEAWWIFQTKVGHLFMSFDTYQREQTEKLVMLQQQTGTILAQWDRWEVLLKTQVWHKAIEITKEQGIFIPGQHQKEKELTCRRIMSCKWQWLQRFQLKEKLINTVLPFPCEFKAWFCLFWKLLNIKLI